tara:strand:+ start:149 stop:517 length:369 start_codon:yes stop_codon:yes gene_type:complete
MVDLYTIFTIIYYDNICQTYKPIVCINKIPNGNLKNYVKKITNPKLSPFQTNNEDYCDNSCLIAIISFNNCDQYLNPNNLNELYEFMLNNNYSINYEFTNLINETKNRNINNKKLIMYISYN